MNEFRDRQTGIVYEMDEHELPEHVTDYEDLRAMNSAPETALGRALNRNGIYGDQSSQIQTDFRRETDSANDTLTQLLGRAGDLLGEWRPIGHESKTEKEAVLGEIDHVLTVLRGGGLT